MTFILTIKEIDSSEREIDLETSNKEEALCIANEYMKDEEGLIQYAYLWEGTTSLEYSRNSCYFQDEE